METPTLIKFIPLVGLDRGKNSWLRRHARAANSHVVLTSTSAQLDFFPAGRRGRGALLSFSIKGFGRMSSPNGFE
jgi:hypothetical protein